MNEKQRKIYDALINSGYQLPEFDKFSTGLQDKSKAEKLYSKLIEDGYQLPEFDKFYEPFSGSQQEVVTNQQEAQQPKAVEPKSVEKEEKEFSFWDNALAGIKSTGRSLYSGILDFASDAVDVIANPIPLTAGGLDYLSTTKQLQSKGVDIGAGKEFRKESDYQYQQSQEEALKGDPESLGFFVGSLLPSTAGSLAAIGSAYFSAPLALGVGALNMASLGAASYGSGARAYSEYKKEKGLEEDPLARHAVGLLYGSAEFAMEKLALNKFLPKGLKGKMGDLFFGGAPLEVIEQTSKDLIRDFAESSAKRMNLVKKTLEGMGTEGATEFGTEILQELTNFMYEEREDWKSFWDIAKSSGMSFLGGALMGGALGPIAFGAQSVQNNKRREEAGKVSFAKTTKDNTSVEVVGKVGSKNGEDVYRVLKPNGDFVNLTKSEISEPITIPYGDYLQIAKGYTDAKKEMGEDQSSFDKISGLEENKGYSFNYDSEENIPKELKSLIPISKKSTSVDGKDQITLTFSGKQLKEAGLGDYASNSVIDSKTDEDVEIERNKLGEHDFIRTSEGLVYEKGNLTLSKAESLESELKKEYPNLDFQIINNTDKDPLAKANFTIIAKERSVPKYSINGTEASRDQVEKTIKESKTIEELGDIKIENDKELEDLAAIKFSELNLSKKASEVKDVSVEEVAPTEETVDSPKLSEQSGNQVTVNVGGERVSGTVQVDEGGKVTLETPKGTVYELEDSTPFTEFVRPVSISDQGDIEVNGESFAEARIVIEGGQPKALLIKEDGTTKAITNPRVVEEIEYQIALANMESMSDQEADNLYNQYEQQRQTETTTEEGVTEVDERTEDDRKLQEALDEIDLIEQMALEELEQAETSSKLVEITPKGAKDSKVYLVNKNQDGTYSATLNGRKVKREEVLAELGAAYETETKNLVGKLQEQVNALKKDVEQKIFGKDAKQEESVLEGVRDGGEQKQIREESSKLRTEEAAKAEEVKPIQNDKGRAAKKGKSDSKPSKAKTKEGSVRKIRELYDKKRPFFKDIKEKFGYPSKATVAKIAKDYDNAMAKKKKDRTEREQEFLDFVDKKIATKYIPPKGKGKTPLDKRSLRGKNALAASLKPNSIEDVIYQWFLNGGRITGDSIEKLFTSAKQGGFKKNVQTEVNSRISYRRKKENGGKTISEAVHEIHEDLGVDFKETPDDVIRNAFIDIIKDNNSVSQMAENLLKDRGEVYIKGDITPMEYRDSVREEDALKEIFTEEELMEASPSDIADALNDYYGDLRPKHYDFMYDSELYDAYTDGGRLTPLPLRESVSFQEALGELFTDEELKKLTPSEIVSALNDYYGNFLDYKYNEYLVQEFLNEKIDHNVEDLNWANEMWESSSEKELQKIEEGNMTLTELAEEDQANIEDAFVPEDSPFIDENVEYREDEEKINKKESSIFEEGKPKIAERPDMENPVYGVLINGKEKFIQRVENNDFDQWYMVEKSKDGVWNTIEPFLGFNKKEALETLYNESNKENKSEIEKQKQAVRDAAKDVKDKFTKGGFDNIGINFDIKKAMEADAAFYDSVVNLIKQYVRLKGMQASEVYQKIEQLLGKKLDSESRKYLKSFIDQARKEIPKVDVMKENKGLTKDEQVKQGLEELIEYKRIKAEEKLAKEKEKSEQKINSLKEKSKARIDEFKRIKKTMIDFLKMDLSDIPASSFTKGEFSKILTQISNANTDGSLNKSISEAYGVYAQAASRQRMSKLNNLRDQAKKNIKQGKLGAIEPNSDFDKLLRLNPKAIPLDQIQAYNELLSQIGERKTILSLSEKSELIQSSKDILNAVELQSSRVSELKDIYEAYDNKSDSYSETIDNMLKDGEITSEEAKLMRDFKKEIVEKEIVEPTEKDIKQAIDDALVSLKEINVSLEDYSSDERSVIKTIKSLTKEDLQELTYEEITRINKLAENIKSGIVPHLSHRIKTKIEGIRSAKSVSKTLFSYKGSWWNFISSLKAKTKNLFGSDTTTIQEKIRRNPLFNVDAILGDFKNTEIYNNVFRKLATPHSKFESDVNSYIENVRVALNKLSKKPKEQFKSRAKLMMLAIQREYESNIGQKGVNTAKSYLDATINAGNNSVYTADSRKTLKEIFDKYADSNGELDSDKLYKSLSKEEKEAFEMVNKMNREVLRPKAITTSALIRGNRVPIYENYIHLPRAVKGTQSEKDVKNAQYGSGVTSTRAGSLMERTGGAKPILFDFFYNSTEGAKMTLLDYHMTPAINEAKATFAQLYKMAESDNDVEMVQSLENVFSEVYDTVYSVYASSTSTLDKVVNEITKKGYQATLSGVGRSISELITNAEFAFIYKSTETKKGMGVVSNNNEATLSKAVSNMPTTQASRLYSFAGMQNKNIDFSRMNVKEISKMTGYDEGVLTRMFKAIKENPAYELVDQIQAFTVSKPDQLVGRAMFWGEFETQFEGITGKKPDYDKIAEGDKEYMSKYEDAIENATNIADRTMIEAVASSNPWEGIARNQINPTKNWLVSYFKTFNGYMTRFPTFEYNSAVRAIKSLTGNGLLTPQDGAKLLTALSIRLMTYSLLTSTLVPFIYKGISKLLFDYEEPEEEKDEKALNNLSKETLSALAMLTVQRNIGNIGKVPINIILEAANKEFGEGVTYEGDYDAFDNSVAYPIIPLDREIGKKPIPQTIIENTAGPLSPQVKTAFRGMTALSNSILGSKKETRDKYIDELKYRTTFEVMGSAGYIPFYKDFRNIMLLNMYNEASKIDEAKSKMKKNDYTKYR
jgi:hypothetical protein